MPTLKKPYTAKELRDFDALTEGESSRDQLVRIRARLRLRAFVAEHGKDKCDAMFSVLQARDAKE